MKSLELKIPPPAIGLLVAVLMWLASLLLDPPQVSFSIRVGAALTLFVIGQTISVGGMRSFRRAKTTMNPFKPDTTSTLVSDGVYRYTRNPMYVGLLITLLGWAAFLWQPWTLVFLPLFVLYITRFQIEPEERVLSSLFGSEYAEYMARVRRWL
jgi:protein-S-isoprenylcysteine O-methyltransferase Ste14